MYGYKNELESRRKPVDRSTLTSKNFYNDIIIYFRLAITCIVNLYKLCLLDFKVFIMKNIIAFTIMTQLVSECLELE